MDDLISRAAAIECAIDAVDDWDGGWNPTREEYIRKYFEDLPAVDAAQLVHGRWIYKERHRKSYRQYTGYDAAGETHTIMVLEESEGKEPYCACCGAQAAESFQNFCPNCGADMRGDNYGE